MFKLGIFIIGMVYCLHANAYTGAANIAKNQIDSLLYAAHSGDLTAVQKLLEGGMNVNVVNAKFESALLHASYGGHAEIVDYLVQVGANVNSATTLGDTPLLHASYNGHKTIVDRLISSGANVHAVNAKGENALMYASYNGHQSVVDRLISSGVNVNASTANGQTALMYAAQTGQPEIADALIHAGANISVETAQGLSALNYAQYAGQSDIAATLQAQGATASTTFTQNVVAQQVAQQVAAEAAAASTAQAGLLSSGVSGTTATTSLATAATLGGGAALAGGGGGTGPTTLNPIVIGDTSKTVTIPDAADNTTPATFETAEHNNQGGLVTINASDAYGRGYTGQPFGGGTKVRVAVVDSGVDMDHPDLAANLNTSLDTDLVDSDNDASPEAQGNFRSHGTHVAGIIAATKNDVGMHGVAYNAEILAIRAGISSGTITKAEEGIEYATANGAKIINNSWGINTSSGDIADMDSEAELATFIGSTELDALKAAVAADIVVVFATGNDGNDQVSVHAGIPHVVSGTRSHWLAVAAVDNSKNIASFSNRCGVAKEWCISAPGVSINSTYDQDDVLDSGDDNYESISGTSMATPHVSGAVAVMMSAFSSLSNQDIVQILLATADKSFAGYNADIHGVGVLDLEEATRPGLEVTIPTGSALSSASSASLAASSISLGTAFGDALVGTDLSFAISDEYKRTFEVDFSNVVQHNFNTSTDLLDAFNAFASGDDGSTEIYVNEDIQASYSMKTVTDDETGQEEEKMDEMGIAMQFAKSKIKANYNRPLQKSFNFSESLGYDNDVRVHEDTLSNPYINFADSGLNTVVSHRVGKDMKVKFAAFHSEDVQEEYEDGDGVSTVSGFATELSAKINDKTRYALQTGVMSEENTFLGSSTGGAFAFEGNTPTWFYGMGVNYDVTDDISFHAMYNQGYTFASANENTLFDSVSTVESNSFGAGVTMNKVFTKTDQVGFSASQPLRVSNGSADIRLPYYVDRNKNVYYNHHQLELAPKGREIDLEGYYKVDFDEDTHLRAAAMYRHEPGHIEGKGAEKLLMFKFSHELQ